MRGTLGCSRPTPHQWEGLGVSSLSGQQPQVKRARRRAPIRYVAWNVWGVQPTVGRLYGDGGSKWIAAHSTQLSDRRCEAQPQSPRISMKLKPSPRAPPSLSRRHGWHLYMQPAAPYCRPPDSLLMATPTFNFCLQIKLRYSREWNGRS